MRVLVVDDNPVNLNILVRQIQSRGSTVAGVASADEAFRVLLSERAVGSGYDAAIIDRAMPVCDGVELGRRIRAEPALASMRLVLATSWAFGHGDAACLPGYL